MHFLSYLAWRHFQACRNFLKSILVYKCINGALSHLLREFRHAHQLVTFSKADDASAIDNLMLFGRGTSEVGDIERDVEVTSALLNVEKKKRLKASALCW